MVVKEWRMKMMIRNKGLWIVLDIVIYCGEWCEVSSVYMEDNNKHVASKLEKANIKSPLHDRVWTKAWVKDSGVRGAADPPNFSLSSGEYVVFV
ncbi:hypothetical protein Hanom_Chr01g00080551 [Helianthus anomalus]